MTQWILFVLIGKPRWGDHRVYDCVCFLLKFFFIIETGNQSILVIDAFLQVSGNTCSGVIHLIIKSSYRMFVCKVIIDPQ